MAYWEVGGGGVEVFNITLKSELIDEHQQADGVGILCQEQSVWNDSARAQAD